MAVVGPTKFTADTKSAFLACAKTVTYSAAVPENEDALIALAKDADALLVSLEVQVTARVMAGCPRLRYIGMCCSLYGPESANVDIPAAQQRGITVTGIRDYGDEGVAEYAICELVSLLHGFHGHMWRTEPTELTGLPIGILGLGTVGMLIARALQCFGANVYYYSRTRKQEAEARGIAYLPLDALLSKVDICISCLNKNAILLHEAQFEAFGDGKKLMNIAIGPSSDAAALAKWLSKSSNYFLCDTPAPLGDPALIILPNVLCTPRGAGASVQSTRRYNEKILANIQSYLGSASP